MGASTPSGGQQLKVIAFQFLRRWKRLKINSCCLPHPTPVIKFEFGKWVRKLKSRKFFWVPKPGGGKGNWGGGVGEEGYMASMLST